MPLDIKELILDIRQTIYKSQVNNLQYVSVAPYEISETGNYIIDISAPIVTTSRKYYASNAQVTANWNAVPGAIDYRLVIWKDGQQIFSKPIGNITSYQINTDSKGDYGIYVIATNGVDYATSQCCQFYVGYLDKPIITSSERYYASGAHVTINWTECTGATKYHVSIWRADEPGMQGVPYGDGADVNGTSYSFDPIDGYYGFYVDAMNMNGGTQIAASDKYNFFVGNMRAPIIDSSIQYYAENGNVTIKWNACDGATDYFVHFWKDHEDYFGEYTNGATSYTFNNAPNGYYGVYVSAVNATGGYQWETSEKYNFTVGTLETPVIDTSIKYYASGGGVTVNWNACEGATKYHISIWRAEEAGAQGVPYGEGADVYDTSYTFSPEDGYYGFYVDAMNTNGGTQIASSEKYNFYVGKLEKPVATTSQKYYGKNSKVTVNWNSCEGATKYYIVVWIPDEQIIDQEVLGTSYTFDTEESKYGVFVFAVNDNGGYQDAVSEKLNFWSTDFSLDKASQTLVAGSELQLNAVIGVMDDDDTITWESSDSSVASVSPEGLIKAVKAGTATVTARLGSLAATCSVTVTNPATAITLSKTSLSLKKGDKSTLTATVTPNDSSDSVTWTSSNTAVATVSNGTVSAVGNGSATITAKAGSKSATCSVTVSNPATAIMVSKTSLNMKKGENATLTATVTPNDSTDSVTWTSSNTAVATVSNGMVTAVGNGSATITAKAGSKSAICSVTVTNPATAITLSKTSLSLIIGDKSTLTATVTPNDSSDNVTWTSSNTAVATISNGTVTAVGKGSTTITAKAGSKSATCTVTVTEPTPTAYDVTPNINGGASKLYEPWGLRYYAAFIGADIDKISDRGIAILKDSYYTSGMTPAQFCANANANIFLSSRNELAFEEATSTNPNGRYFATLTKGIYSYDIGAKYYVVPFAVMNNGQTIYGTIKSNSMENILKANLNLSTITKEEKAICTCILELKKSVAAHYQAAGVPGASVDMNIPRGSSQSAANVKSTTATGITPNVVGGASRLIEPWGLRYFATYTDSSNIVQRGMVILSEKYYQSSYSSSPDNMRLNANAYVFRDSDGTLLYQSETNRYYGTVTEGISSKDIADVYYVVPFVVLNDGSYVYGTVKSNSMMKIMKANLNSSSVPATERAVSQDIIDLYNAVKAYYAAQ